MYALLSKQQALVCTWGVTRRHLIHMPDKSDLKCVKSRLVTSQVQTRFCILSRHRTLVAHGDCLVDTMQQLRDSRGPAGNVLNKLRMQQNRLACKVDGRPIAW